MKKRLEAELISIAHRILKLKNISELKQLHSETQKLYETLSVLKFVEENINSINPKIDVVDLEQKIENAFNKPNEIIDFENEKVEVEESVSIIENDEIKEEKLASENQEINIINQEPVAELNITTIADEIIVKEEMNIKEVEQIFIPELESQKDKPILDKKPEPVLISFEEFKFIEPIFEKKSDIKEEKLVILNEKLSKGINIGLNDKIAFVKHLFGESSEDYNRVLSQINTFETYFDTITFINEIVKPDYNNWENKDEYVLRFLESVEKKFV